MRKIVLSIIVMVVIGAGAFGMLTAHPNFAWGDNAEAIVLWVVPLVILGTLLRTKLPIWVRVALLLGMILGYGVAEYLGIMARPWSDDMTIPASDRYTYGTIYLIIGPIQLVLFLLVLLAEARTWKSMRAAAVAVLLFISSWFFLSTFTDERPLMISPVLLSVVLVSMPFVASLAFVLTRWMRWTRGATLGAIAYLSAFFPVYFA